MAQLRLLNRKGSGENFDGFIFVFSGTRFTTNKHSTADMQHKSCESRMLNTIPVVNSNNCSGINSNTNLDFKVEIIVLIVHINKSYCTTVMNEINTKSQFKSSSLPESN